MRPYTDYCSNRPATNGMVKRLTLTFLILLFCFLADSSIALNPKKIACKNRDMKPAIEVDKCRPSFDTKRNACEKLIRKCKCQHDIEMKWTGKGCPGTKGEGGCQCADYCGWTCPGKCRGDPMKKCQFKNGECSNIATGGKGPIAQCQVATSTPSAAPTETCFPGESIVITTTGPKTMEDLKVGEYVQDIALHDNVDIKAGTVTFSQVIAFLHHQQEETGIYRELHVASDHMDERSEAIILRLSDLHGLFVQDPLTFRYQSIMASQVKIGQRVYLAGSKGTTRAVLGTVIRIGEDVKAEGVYAPLTMSGTLVVDGIHVSSYTHVRHDTVNVAYAPLRLYAKYIGPVPEWYTAKGIHYFSAFLQSLFEPILPLFIMQGGST